MSLNEYEMKKGKEFVYRFVKEKPESMLERIKRAIGIKQKYAGYRTGDRKDIRPKANAFYDDHSVFTASTEKGAKFYAKEAANGSKTPIRGYIIKLNVNGIPQIDTHAQYKKISKGVNPPPVLKKSNRDEHQNLMESYYKHLDEIYDKHNKLLEPSRKGVNKHSHVPASWKEMDERQQKRLVLLNSISYSKHMSGNEEIVVNAKGSNKPTIVEVKSHNPVKDDNVKGKIKAWQVETEQNYNQVS